MASSRHTVRALALVLALALGASTLTGCTPEMKSLALEFLEAWIAQKTEQVGTARMLFGGLVGYTGDPEIDAVLQTKSTIETVNKADGLAADAERARLSDPIEAVRLLDEAIALRPDDYSYRLQKAAIKLEYAGRGGWGPYDEELAAVTQELDEAEADAANNSMNMVDFYSTGIDQLEGVYEPITASEGSLGRPLLYERLENYHRIRAELHKQNGDVTLAGEDLQSAEFYREQASRVSQ